MFVPYFILYKSLTDHPEVWTEFQPRYLFIYLYNWPFELPESISSTPPACLWNQEGRSPSLLRLSPHQQRCQQIQPKIYSSGFLFCASHQQHSQSGAVETYVVKHLKLPFRESLWARSGKGTFLQLHLGRGAAKYKWSPWIFTEYELPKTFITVTVLSHF